MDIALTDRFLNYLRNPRDAVAEDRLAIELRAMPSNDAEALIWQGISVNEKVGLLFAKRVIRERRFFEKLLKEALQRADAGMMRFWLEASLPKLGTRRVEQLVREAQAAAPIGAQKALYWLPRIQTAKEKKSRK